MSAPQFTPGPWMASPYSSIVGIGVIGQRGRVIAHVAVAPGFNPTAKHEQQEHVDYAAEIGANASLIAAAPELYEALVEARIAVAADIEEAECGDDGRYASFLPVFVERLAKIDAALAKARGDQ